MPTGTVSAAATSSRRSDSRRPAFWPAARPRRARHSSASISSSSRPTEVELRIARLQQDYDKRFGRDESRLGAAGAAGRRLRLRARPLALHRLPALCVRLREGEQPVARPADPVDPRPRDGEGQGHRLRGGQPLLQPGHAFPTPITSIFRSPASSAASRSAPRSARSGATWQEPDGIVVIDYDWCIGCRCCMAACPYGARHFNWGEPQLPAAELNPNMHVLGNRPRPRGVVEKCTFCIQRTRAGRYPACVEICPVGARKFGNLLDPESEISRILQREAGLRAQGRAQDRAEVLLLLRHVARSHGTDQVHHHRALVSHCGAARHTGCGSLSSSP